MANLNFNKVILGGRLTSTPELRSTANGTLCTNFNIAVSRRLKDGSNETDFIGCTVWGSTADFVTKWFRKGSSILVTGSLRNRKWTDSNGIERSTNEVNVDEVSFVDSKDEAQSAGPKPTETKPAPKFEDVTEDDDLPF